MCSSVRSFDRFFVVSAKHLDKTAAALKSKDEDTKQLWSPESGGRIRPHLGGGAGGGCRVCKSLVQGKPWKNRTWRTRDTALDR